MDPHIARLLNDKLYDKRKTGALEYVHKPCTNLSSIYPAPSLLILGAGLPHTLFTQLTNLQGSSAPSESI